MERGYRGLKVYEKSYALSVQMYKIASKMPKEELYGLQSQIKRATTSIPLNIAEGHGKMESIRFQTVSERYLHRKNVRNGSPGAPSFHQPVKCSRLLEK